MSLFSFHRWASGLGTVNVVYIYKVSIPYRFDLQHGQVIPGKIECAEVGCVGPKDVNIAGNCKHETTHSVL